MDVNRLQKILTILTCLLQAVNSRIASSIIAANGEDMKKKKQKNGVIFQPSGLFLEAENFLFAQKKQKGENTGGGYSQHNRNYNLSQDGRHTLPGKAHFSNGEFQVSNDDLKKRGQINTLNDVAWQPGLGATLGVSASEVYKRYGRPGVA